jgi:Icc-related predicted phosphoesterase
LAKIRILAVSDRVEAMLLDPASTRQFAGVDLIVSCGDLPADYLECLVTLWNVPLVYVPGNHDPDAYSVPGGIALDGAVRQVAGLTAAGLGGSLRYKPEGRHQYTQRQMAARVALLLARLLLQRAVGRGPLDLFVSHASPLGIHDQPDHAHTGFNAFHRLLRWSRPALYLHGHHHAVANLEVTDSVISGTRIVNVFPVRRLDLDLGGR